jgi:hypothetical protein
VAGWAARRARPGIGCFTGAVAHLPGTWGEDTLGYSNTVLLVLTKRVANDTVVTWLALD